jgi:DNA phosphorothioation-dependent restriction protein DptG
MMTSGKLIAAILIATLTITSCGKEEKQLTPKQIRERADSIYKSNLKKIQQQAKEDYEKRLPIELKPKVDSILQRKMEAAPIPVFPEDNISVDDTI